VNRRMHLGRAFTAYGIMDVEIRAAHIYQVS
jgi:hypothetical protein